MKPRCDQWERRRQLVRLRMPTGRARDAALDIVNSLDMGVEPSARALDQLRQWTEAQIYKGPSAAHDGLGWGLLILKLAGHDS